MQLFLREIKAVRLIESVHIKGDRSKKNQLSSGLLDNQERWQTMENTTANNDVAGATHNIKHYIRKFAESASEQMYKYCTAADDRLEKFRQAVSELLEVRKNAAVAEEKIYQVSAACDDKLEYFRQDVVEMVSALILMGDLVARRVYQGILRTRGLRKTYGNVAVDRKFERHAEKVFNHLREGRFGGTVEGMENRHRRISALFDSASLRTHRRVKRVEARIDSIIENFMENRKRWTVTIATMAGCFMMFCVTVNAGTVYNYYYHGTEIGTVKDKTDVEAAAEQVKEAVPEGLNIEVDVKAEPDVDITYEKQISFTAAIDSVEEVADKLVKSNELEGNGYAIRVNGEVVALVDTEETAAAIMETVRENYCTVSQEEADAVMAMASQKDETEIAENAETAESDAVENVNGKIYDLNNETIDAVDNEEQHAPTEADAAVARAIILGDSMNAATGVVAEGQYVATDVLANALGQYMAADYSMIDFTAADPTAFEGISLNNVIIEDEVIIEPVTAKVSDFSDFDTAISLFIDENGKSKIFNISTAEIEIYTEPVEYNTVYEETEKLYRGESQVKTAGVNGEMQIAARVTKENGEEVSREIVNQTVITEPVDEVVLQGTNDKPKWYPTGKFINPASGKFSSGFGRRWGRSHQGIDIAGSYGTPVVASDGGTVVFAGYNSSGYGNLIKIDHGNGYVTCYAHNSSLCVSVGDKVYQGQVIAKMGSTGRSTGNHCHFEVRINGTAVDPMKYLNK